MTRPFRRRASRRSDTLVAEPALEAIRLACAAPPRLVLLFLPLSRFRPSFLERPALGASQRSSFEALGFLVEGPGGVDRELELPPCSRQTRPPCEWCARSCPSQRRLENLAPLDPYAES